MLKSVAGRPIPFKINRLPQPHFTRLSRKIGLRTISGIGGKVAVPVIVDSYSEDNFVGSFWSINCEHPCATTLYSAFGQSFQVSDKHYNITKAKFYLNRSGSAEGTLVAVLYAKTGTQGTNAKPTGTPLATSDQVDMTDISTSFGLVEFTFPSNEQYKMLRDTVYCIECEASSLITGTIPVGADSASPTHGGNLSGYTDGVWGSSSAWDVIFYVYGVEA